MNSLTATTPLREAQELVRTLTTAADDLTSRCQTLEANRAAQAERVTELEARRMEIVEAIARGAGSDSDLAKLRRELGTAKDKLVDAEEVCSITASRLSGVARDLQNAIAARKTKEVRAWRQASNDLIETHRAEIQARYDEIYVATCCYQSGTIYSSMLPALGLKSPQEADFVRIRGRLAEQFNL